ncbi:MAG: hypothetical protein SVY10_21830 [Thermodesulfobacteriota bacterium]|nr:hypothetical protein [Thermodesulfobacteriota bacterium]
MIIEKLNFLWVYVTNSNPDIPYKGKWDFPKTKEEYFEHWGKWVIFGEKEYLDELACQLDPYVEDRHICNIKYLREALVWTGFDQPAMCVYCDDREKEDIWQILSGVGLTDKLWIYERETIAAWLPGGELIEKMITYYKLSPEKSERVRERIRQDSEGWLYHLYGEGDKDKDTWNLEQMIWKLAQEKMKQKGSKSGIK